MRKKLLVLAVAAQLIQPSAYANYPVVDMTLIQVVQTNFKAVLAAMSSQLTLLQNIGMAVNQNGSKIATTIEASAKAQRDFDVEMERTRNIQNARRAYQVASSICSESASGGAAAIASGSGSSKGSFRPGGGATINNSTIKAALTSPPVSRNVDASRSASIHAQFCDTTDFAAYGGTESCPAVNTKMPGADKRLDSIIDGAGEDGKKPDLTFNQEQTDAAQMYTQNSIRRSVGKSLTKTEATSAAGVQYVGSYNQLNSILSAAADPQERTIANRQPLPITKDLLKEALLSPSAATYYKEVASPEAKRQGMMSLDEFESFEVGRRYSNTEYQTDLQAMDSDNLLREQIRISTLQSWLMLGIKNELVRSNILSGQQLASQARAEFEPMLESQYRSIGSSLGGGN